MDCLDDLTRERVLDANDLLDALEEAEDASRRENQPPRHR